MTPWTVALQAPLSMEFSRKENWSGLPFLPPGDLPYPGAEPTFVSLALQAESLPDTLHLLKALKKKKKLITKVQIFLQMDGFFHFLSLCLDSLLYSVFISVLLYDRLQN